MSNDKQALLTKLQAEQAQKQIDASEIADADAVKLPDMPTTVLDGRLGELCATHMKDFPIAYSWLSVLAAASALVRRNASTLRTNLYVALVGKPHSGKTAAVDHAKHLLDVKEPLLADVKAGSAEGLAAKLGDRKGDSVLLWPDELCHLLDKAQIKGASFSSVLNSLFYYDENTLIVAHRKEVRFHCRLSIIGGIIEEKFDDAFASTATGGLYDRFLFGQCPTDFAYRWRPIEGGPAFDGQVDEVHVNRDVWEAKDELARNEGLNPRVVELALRCAAICAAFDCRDELRAKNLAPAWELTRYQTRVRMLLQPNPGKNFEAQVAFKILAYLNRHAADGKWLSLSKVFHDTRAFEYSPSIANRAVDMMAFSGAIERAEQKPEHGRKMHLVRLPVSKAI